jgi:hypothetical protein
MNGPQLGFLKITESIEYFLPFVRPEGGQDIQDLSFAHGQSVRAGATKDKRPLGVALARPVEARRRADGGVQAKY